MNTERILELKNQRFQLWESAKNYLETHRGEDNMVSAEDTAVYEKMEADVVALGEEIERLERQRALDEKMSKPSTEPVKNDPSKPTETKAGIASENYKTAFWNRMRNKNYIYNDLQVGENSEGGYLVPDEYERTLVQALEDENFLRSVATVIKTSSGDRKIPVVEAKGTAAWIDEEAHYPFSDDVFGQTTIGAYKLGTMIRVSEELLNDSVFNIESYIANEFARRIGAAEEEAFLTGDGIGKPTGIFTQEATLKTAKPQLTFDDVMDLYYSLRAPYRNKAIWVLNDSTIKALRKLKDGNGNYIWQPSIRDGEPDKILNRPYYTSVYAPAIDAEKENPNVHGVIAFGDFSYYWIADREGRSFKRLNELYAETGQVGFLANQRVDGKLILAEAIKTLELTKG